MLRRDNKNWINSTNVSALKAFSAFVALHVLLIIGSNICRVCVCVEWDANSLNQSGDRPCGLRGSGGRVEEFKEKDVFS